MITLTCDKCDRAIEVPDDAAGTKVDCPSCGDVNRVPGAHPSGVSDPRPQTDAKPDRAEAAGYPPDSGPEQTVVTLRPCVVRSRPLLFMLVFAIGLGGLALGITGLVQSGAWKWIVGGLAMAASIGVIGFWWVLSMSAALVVTNKRTVEKRGLLSRSTSEVVHDNIRNIQVTQSFWQRLWGVGVIGISSSGQDGIEIQMDRLRSPDRAREVIDLYRPI